MSVSTVMKTSISLKPYNWKRLENVKNRSIIINQALDLFFQKKAYMAQMEDKRLEQAALEWLRNVAKDEMKVLNPNGKKISKKQIHKFLRNKK